MSHLTRMTAPAHPPFDGEKRLAFLIFREQDIADGLVLTNNQDSRYLSTNCVSCCLRPFSPLQPRKLSTDFLTGGATWLVFQNVVLRDDPFFVVRLGPLLTKEAL
jgi:hypothetical protein